jgi:hypothetical protein
MAEGAQLYTALCDEVELMQVQALIAHGSIETLLLAILPGLARLDIDCLDATLRKLGLNRYNVLDIDARQNTR